MTRDTRSGGGGGGGGGGLHASGPIRKAGGRGCCKLRARYEKQGGGRGAVRFRPGRGGAGGGDAVRFGPYK